MTIEKLDKLYSMKFKHSYANGELELFKETLENGEVSYWINADENMNNDHITSFVAVKFNLEQLEELSQCVIKELDNK